MKFEVSGTSQAVLFEAGVPAELSACSVVNEKFRYRLVSLDFLVLLYQDKRTETLLEVMVLMKCCLIS